MTEFCILFADIAESTSLFEKHGDEKARGAIAAVLDVLLKQAESHQGELVKTIGDENHVCVSQGQSRHVGGCGHAKRGQW